MSLEDPNKISQVSDGQDRIELAPDQDDDETVYKRKPARRRRSDESLSALVSSDANQETRLETKPDNGQEPKGRSMSLPLRWALDSMHEPAMAAADWLARDIDPTQPSAASLLSNPAITLAQVRQAKSVFKTMRIVGEKAADRRIGARMYAAAIAAGLVRHGQKVSRQSDAALQRGFQALLDDRRMPGPLRDLGGMALCLLKDRSHLLPGHPLPRSKSA